MEKLKVCSLFSGCGGMDLGINGNFTYLNNFYKKNPINIVYAVDNDKYAVEIYNKNFPHRCVMDDIRNVHIDDIPAHDILIGGFPCQSFSISAQNPPRLGFKDERGKLFFEIVRILKERQPKYFVLENVKGLLSANKKQTFPMILDEFRNAGYFVKYEILNSSTFGVPQKRERVFIIGFKSKMDYDTFKFPKNESIYLQKNLKDVIDQKVEEKYFFSNKAVAGMLKVQEKMNKGRAQNINQPCNTISSHLSKVSLNSTDPVLFIEERYRRFTPREAARIQSFPESFNFEIVSENRQYRAIGNAVPPVMMWHVTQSLIDTILSQKNSVEINQINYQSHEIAEEKAFYQSN